MVAEYKHTKLALLNHDEYVHPGLGFGPLSCRLPVLLAAEHALFCPWWTQECEFLVCNTELSRYRMIAPKTVAIVLLCFTDDGMREV